MEFIKAKPIWLEGLEKEMNLQAGFKAKIVKQVGKKYQIKIAVAYVYRLFINGDFVCYGPARAAHGYARVDRVDITEKLAEGENTIAVETVGYNVNSYYLINRPAFICCEVESDGEAVVATGYDFNGLRLTERVQKCQRYSFQRPFPDVWKLNRESARYNWQINDIDFDSTQLTDINVKFLERSSVMPDFAVIDSAKIIEQGTFEEGTCPHIVEIQRYNGEPSEDFLCFPKAELEEAPMLKYYKSKMLKLENIDHKDEIVIREGNYVIVDMKKNHSGFVKMVNFPT